MSDQITSPVPSFALDLHPAFNPAPAPAPEPNLVHVPHSLLFPSHVPLLDCPYPCPYFTLHLTLSTTQPLHYTCLSPSPIPNKAPTPAQFLSYKIGLQSTSACSIFPYQKSTIVESKYQNQQ